ALALPVSVDVDASLQACKKEPETEDYGRADSADAQVAEPEAENYCRAHSADAQVPEPSPSTPSPDEATQVDTCPEAAKAPESLQPTQVDSPGLPPRHQVPAQHMQLQESDDDEADGDFAVKSVPPPALSKDAVYHKMRRMMLPRADGSYLVGPEFREQYKDKHHGRPKLEAMFERAGYNPELFVKRCKYIQESIQEETLEIDGEQSKYGCGTMYWTDIRVSGKLNSMHALSLACIVNFIQDPSLAAALHADPALEEEMDEQQDEEMPQNGATLKTGFPKLEDDMQPSSLLLPASKCMSRHAKKLDQLLLRFKPNPESEGQGKELTDLQASLLG
ncbi:unnamed protein product, partial [Symbiodinium necroappetens]